MRSSSSMTYACVPTLPNAPSGVERLTPAEHVDPRAELAHHPIDLPPAVAQHDVVRRVAELGPVALGFAQQPRQVQQRATPAAVLLLRPLTPLGGEVDGVDDLQAGPVDGVVDHPRIGR